MTQTVSAALARKISAGQEEQGDKPRSVLRAMRLAFARAAGDRLHLPLSVIGARQSSRTSEALTDTIGGDWLLLQLVNAQGLSAAVCMDLGAVSAIVQVQTIGEVMPGAPAPRAFTHTDAAMVAPLVEDALSRAVTLVDAVKDQSALSGFEFASRLADLRTLSLAMVEDAYRVYDLTIELGGGLRQGQLSVVLPDSLDEVGEQGEHPVETGPNLDQASGVLRAELNTVICRMTLPLASLSSFGVGDLLPLNGSRLDRAEILTIERTRAAIGRLGQCGGMRAVRLNEYASLQVLSPADAQEFLEARSPAAPHNPTALTEDPPEVSMYDPNVLADQEPSLNFTDSDQMVAEISQLAGLTPPDKDTGGVG
ncbi:FliM/FliN family flagellar motor C-terminal domain-containing protein [Ruegeria meonggei]|uniref:Surface presentation of antigens (SPOA) n=1 Tax=Ruegeria meonggei TaxID=1446476 RepID=A0A1X7AC32_9RHOB|nr:FliM/FliN family flagellar motor C-terminal domain-containing protein [Ruegeria meonggei]SLN75285.1 Surface presentation of antigens (SPOA) [Ruegeria meonggei]